MARLVPFATVGFGLVVGVAGWAQDASRLHPMDQFEVELASPSDIVDRSADSYARCAGRYSSAVQQDAGNDHARNAEAVLMEKALSVGSSADKEALYRLRDGASDAARQRVVARQAVDQKIYQMGEAQMADLSKEQAQALLAPVYAEMVFAVQCDKLLRELDEG